MTVPVDPIAIALSVSHVLDTIGISHTIGGSLASSFAGEPRSTVDIDFVAALEESHIPALVSALSAEFYVDDEALRRAVRPGLDREYLAGNAPILGVADLLARALREAVP